MILIFSEQFDLSTNQVIDWIWYSKPKTKMIRANESSIFEIICTEKKIKFKQDSITFSLDSINSIWYRRFNSDCFNYKKFNHDNLDNFLSNEYFNITQFIFFILSKKVNISSPFSQMVNRLLVTYQANQIGLKSPINYLLSHEKYLKKISHKLISKTISGSTIIKNDKTLGYYGIAYTNEVKHNKNNSFKNFSYFEEKVDKLYELRIFYFNGNFRTMAIFSQKDNQTKLDFRHYNSEKPNRTVAFNLPSDIENKLTKLMNVLSLNFGSIDMIVSKNREYYFLEVNPVGQFGMVSFPCNYNIEKDIAKYLL